MKKTNCIQLVLITAALAGCDRPLYQPYSPGTYDQDPRSQRPYYPMDGTAGRAAAGGVAPRDVAPGDVTDSTNSCPLENSQLPPDYYLWQSGLQPFDFYYDGPFRLFGYYAYRFPALVVRAGFGRFGGGGHS